MQNKSVQALLATIVLLIVTILFAYLFYRTGVRAAATGTSSTAGTSMYGLAFKDFSGKDVHLYDYRRKPVVVYAWASWCPYCGPEMQHLAEVQAQYSDRIQIVAINRGEAHATAKDYADKFGVAGKLIFLLDMSDAYFKSIGGYAMPETLYINAAGETVSHTRGPAKPGEVDVLVETLLK